MKNFSIRSIINNPLGVAMVFAVGLVFLLPYERIPSIDIHGSTLRLSQAAALGMICFASPFLFKNRRLLLNKQYLLLGLFLFCYLTAALLAIHTVVALKIFIFTAFVATAAVVLSLLPNKEAQFVKYEKALLYTSVVVLLVGLYQYLGDVFGLNYHLTGLREAYTKTVFGFPRIQATALEPLFLANFLLIPLFVFASSYILDAKKTSPIKPILIVLLASEIFLTVSRGAIIGLLCGTVLLALLTIRKKWKNYAKYLGLLVVAGLLAYSMTAIENPFAKNTNLNEKGSQKQQRIIKQTTNLDSQSDRSRNRNLAIDAFKQSPVVGIGPGNFDDYAKKRFPEYQTAGNPAITVNNLPLEILAEGGIIGFVSLLAFLGYLLVKATLYILKKDGYLMTWALGLIAYMVATAIQYQTFSTFYIMHVWVVIGLLMAIVLPTNTNKLRKNINGKQEKPARTKN